MPFPKFPNRCRQSFSSRQSFRGEVFPQMFNILAKFIETKLAAFNFETTLVLHTRTRCTRVIRVQPCTGLPSYVTVNDVAYLHTGTRSTYVANFIRGRPRKLGFSTCFQRVGYAREVRTGHVKPVHRLCRWV